MHTQLDDHPIRVLTGLLLLAFGLFLLSASGQPGAGWENGPTWLGYIGWFSFLLTALGFILVALCSLLRRVRAGRSA